VMPNSLMCPTHLCHSTNTKLIERKFRMYIDKGMPMEAYIDETWLCNTCGVAFTPATRKLPRWHIPIPSINKRRGQKPIPKKWIIEELFSGLYK